MSTVRSQQHAPFNEGPEDGWQCIEGPPPEKIFIWDREGTYVACQFPNPIYGHFLGGEKLLGMRVTEVLSDEAATRVLQGIRRVLRQQEPSQVWIRLSREGVGYRVCIRLIPSAQLVIGWVNDFRIHEEQEIPAAHNGVQQNLSPGPLAVDLSDQERNIAEGVLAGKSNQGIADRFSIKEGTVKFHLSNIYRKLHLTSRVQLALQGSALLQRTSAQDMNKPRGQDSDDNA